MPTAKTIVSWGVRHTGISAAVRHLVARHRVSILLYHDPSEETIRSHLKYLRPRYNGVRLSDYIDIARTGEWERLPDYPLIVTFDDGWRGNLRAGQLLAEAGFPPTIYLCSQIVGTYRHFWWTEVDEDDAALKPLPTEERIAALATAGFGIDREYPERQALLADELGLMRDQVEFGAHTRTHPILTVCGDDEAWTEISVSRAETEALVGRSCLHFAYPNGDYTDREATMAQQAGFASARTVDVGWNGPSADLFRLKCLPTVDHASVDRLAADLSGAGFLWRRGWTGKWDGRHPTTVATSARRLDVQPT